MKTTNYPKVILINGKIKSGKDTIGKLMKDTLQAGGKKVLTLKYAKPLKKMSAALIGCRPQLQEERHIKTKVYGSLDGYTPREFWVFLSAGMKSEMGDTVFANLLFHDLTEAMQLDEMFNSKLYDYVIIDDWRYDYEADHLQKLYAKVYGEEIAKAMFQRVRIQMTHERELEVKEELTHAYYKNSVTAKGFDEDDMTKDEVDLCLFHAQADVAETIYDGSETQMDEYVGSGYFDKVLMNSKNGFTETKLQAVKYIKHKILCE